MSITFKIKRGTLTNHNTYIGQSGELTMVTDSGKESVRIHDGTTQGGFELARKDLKNINIPVGGVNFEYLFDENAVVVNAEIETGWMGFSDTSPGGDEETLVVSDVDRYGSALTQFLSTIGTVSNATLGHFKIYRKEDASKFKIFEIYGSVDATDQFEFQVYQVASSITDFVHEEILILSYISSGIDAITAILTKTTHSFPSDTFGVIDSTEYTDGIFGLGVFLGLNVIEADDFYSFCFFKNCRYQTC